MKIVSFNVNGLRAIHKKGFLDWLTKSKIDIICLQEIKAETNQLPEELLKIKGYHSYFNSAEKKGYSGTAIYSKIEAKKEEYSLGLNRFDKEGRVIKLQYPKFSLMNLYMPQGGRQKQNLEYKLESYDYLLDNIKNEKNLIIVGDFNIAHKEIDLARPKENKNSICFTSEEREKIDRLLELDFIDTFREFNKEGENYSWWSYRSNARARNIGWRVDCVFASKNLKKKIKNSFISSEVIMSDHCPVGINIF